MTLRTRTLISGKVTTPLVSLAESVRTRTIRTYTESHSDHILWAMSKEPVIVRLEKWPAGDAIMEDVIARPEHILAIGGSKHFEMLPYEGAPGYRVAIPTEIMFERDYDPGKIRDVNAGVQVETYRVEKLGFQNNRKLVYVHESISVDEAMYLLQEGLLQMFIGQPYA